jgi:arylsulfatase A-like enzyme
MRTGNDLNELNSPPRRSTVLEMAAWFGLTGGCIDLLCILVKKTFIYKYTFLFESKHFVWMVPLSNLVILIAAGLALWALERLGPRRLPGGFSAWSLAMLALVGPLLRMPLDWWASVLLATGLAFPLGEMVQSRPRLVRRCVAGLSALLATTVVISLAQPPMTRYWKEAHMAAPPPGGRNVLLIVLDAVRSQNLSLYGYPRDTTPNLRRWSAKGVTFEQAIAPAPWTFPSHTCFLTGQWPYKFNMEWTHAVDQSFPTLAEYLSARGVLTAGFVSNTMFCSYETGLDRGFLSYEDYHLTPRAVLASSFLGRKLIEATLDKSDLYTRKWLKFQSRGAREINRAFLDWADSRHPAARPFFAFLNYMDAHEPFVTPKDNRQHFGLTPQSPEEVGMLVDWWNQDKRRLAEHQIVLARDAYDDCIAELDSRIGELLDELERRNLLESTMVIVTSDHGEHLGEQHLFNHGYGLHLVETQVPLMILASSSEGGRRVARQVSLRDLPATVIDFLGLEHGSALPGRSLSSLLRNDPNDSETENSPALSEIQGPYFLTPQTGRSPTTRGTTFSLLLDGLHYIRYMTTSGWVEELYNLGADPTEADNLATEVPLPAVLNFRSLLWKIIQDDPIRNGRSGLISFDFMWFVNQLGRALR